MSYKRGLAIVFGCAIAGLVAFAATYTRFYSSASAIPAAAAPLGASAEEVLSPLSSLASPPSPMAWARLTDAQRVALAPFASEWDQFSEERKRNWIKIASRYKKMLPDAQKRLHERMTEWIHMTPDQRKVARENYQVSKSVPVEKRERAWDAYQKLPEDQKKKLAATEHPRRPTVVSAPPSGKTEVKDIDRLMTDREHARASEAVGEIGASGSAGAPCARYSQRRQLCTGYTDSRFAAAGAVRFQRVIKP
ncbi:MAG: Putative transmembrane protein [uncultured Caballeronia sp.]|nr:MAG: Putative transmembrane protein [uncultured Caballeronia sp.]